MPLQIEKSTSPQISDNQVFAQVDKIFQDPRYAGSGILKRFLRFVTGEKLNGRSHLVKEYTVAVSVLNKPWDFNPQESAIVRIHAARLRKLLAEYYAGPGLSDKIRITLPKGHYIPVIIENKFTCNETTRGNRGLCNEIIPGKPGFDSVAVFPFHCHGRDESTLSLADGLGQGLSTALMKIRSVSVIAYSLMRMMPARFSGNEEWQMTRKPAYVFTGDVQRQKNKVRISIQFARYATGELLWCHVYEREIDDKDIFSIQDEVAGHVICSVKKIGVLPVLRRGTVPLIAVA